MHYIALYCLTRIAQPKFWQVCIWFLSTTIGHYLTFLLWIVRQYKIAETNLTSFLKVHVSIDIAF